MCFVVITMLLGLPVGFAFGLGGFAMIFAIGLDPRFAIPAAFRNLESYTLLALPLFILAGGLMRDGDISRRLIAFTMSFLDGQARQQQQESTTVQQHGSTR